MILLSFSLFIQYDLLQCVEFEKVDITSLLRAHNQNSSLRNNTPAVYQLDPITPEYAFFTPPDGFHPSPTLPHQTRRSQNIHDTRHKISNNYFKKYHGFTVLDISKKSEEREESQEKASSYNSREHDISERSSSESEQKREREALRYNPLKNMPKNRPRAKEKVTYTSESSEEEEEEPEFYRTRRPKTVSPAILKTRRTEETTRHKRKLKPNLLLPITITDDRNPDKFKTTTPLRSKHEWNIDGNNVFKTKKPRKDKHERVFGDDNDIFKMLRPRKDEAKKVLRMHAIKKKHRQSHKHDRIADNEADIFNKMSPPRNKHEWDLDGNDVLMRNKSHKDKHVGMFGDDEDIFKMMRQRKVKEKNIARMQVISDTTKKMWYSDRMIVESEEEAEDMKNLLPSTTRQSLREIPNDDWSRYDESNEEQDSTTIKYWYKSSSVEYLRAPLSKNYFFKIMEHRREGYMIVFLIEMAQIIATKDKVAVYDVVKHADSIIHRQSKTLQWMGHPFLDVTRQFTTMLKETDIATIQAQAFHVYHQLLQRHDALPLVANSILEYAAAMFDDDEGKVLFDVLREFVTFPDIALSGYWLCNSLINAFLRPFRRLKDTQQLRELMLSINLALKKQNPLWSDQNHPHYIARGFGAQMGGPAVDNDQLLQKDSLIQIGPEIITPRTLWKRKIKHYHRHNKRSRDKEEILKSSYSNRNQRLSLTSVIPRTKVWLRFRDTTYATY